MPASYLGVLTNAGILKADLFRNLQVVWTVQIGLSQMENGKTALMNQRQEILSSLIGKATVQQTTLVIVEKCENGTVYTVEGNSRRRLQAKTVRSRK